MSDAPETDVARFYTRSRRFPKLIGRFNDGTKIPGGPYKPFQLIVGAIVLAGALITKGVWGSGSILFFDGPIAAALGWGTAWVVGRIPSTRRNLVSVAAGGIGAMLRPPVGNYRGQQFKLDAPHFAAGRTTIAIADHVMDETPFPEPLFVETISPERPPRSVSAVQQLLQQSKK